MSPTVLRALAIVAAALALGWLFLQRTGVAPDPSDGRPRPTQAPPNFDDPRWREALVVTPERRERFGEQTIAWAATADLPPLALRINWVDQLHLKQKHLARTSGATSTPEIRFDVALPIEVVTSTDLPLCDPALLEVALQTHNPERAPIACRTMSVAVTLSQEWNHPGLRAQLSGEQPPPRQDHLPFEERTAHYLGHYVVRNDSNGTAPTRFEGWVCGGETPGTGLGLSADATRFSFRQPQCFQPAGGLDRWRPARHGIERRPLHIECMRRNRGCVAHSVYAGRSLVLQFGRMTPNEVAQAVDPALRRAIGALDRMVQALRMPTAKAAWPLADEALQVCERMAQEARGWKVRGTENRERHVRAQMRPFVPFCTSVGLRAALLLIEDKNDAAQVLERLDAIEKSLADMSVEHVPESGTLEAARTEAMRLLGRS